MMARNSKKHFDWHHYMDWYTETASKKTSGSRKTWTLADPSCFFQPDEPPINNFKVGQKLAYYIFSNTWHLVSVKRVFKIWISVTIDGVKNSGDYWVHCDQDLIAYARGLPPNWGGYKAPYNFQGSQEDYLKFVEEQLTVKDGVDPAAPEELFEKVLDLAADTNPDGNFFKLGDKFEVADKDNFDQVLRPATVTNVNGELVSFHYNGAIGWDSYNQDVFYSRWFYPCGWAEKCGIPMVLPKAYIKYLNSPSSKKVAYVEPQKRCSAERIDEFFTLESKKPRSRRGRRPRPKFISSRYTPSEADTSTSTKLPIEPSSSTTTVFYRPSSSSDSYDLPGHSTPTSTQTTSTVQVESYSSTEIPSPSEPYPVPSISQRPPLDARIESYSSTTSKFEPDDLQETSTHQTLRQIYPEFYENPPNSVDYHQETSDSDDSDVTMKTAASDAEPSTRPIMNQNLTQFKLSKAVGNAPEIITLSDDDEPASSQNLSVKSISQDHHFPHVKSEFSLSYGTVMSLYKRQIDSIKMKGDLECAKKMEEMAYIIFQIPSEFNSKEIPINALLEEYSSKIANKGDKMAVLEFMSIYPKVRELLVNVQEEKMKLNV